MAINSLQIKNIRKIKSRLSSLQANEKVETARIFEDVIKDAYGYAFELHDVMGLDLHFIRGGDFARAVVQNQKVLDEESTAGNGSPSLRIAEEAMVFEHIPSAPRIGILGVVAAGILNPPEELRQYKEDHEQTIFKALSARAKDRATVAMHNLKML